MEGRGHVADLLIAMFHFGVVCHLSNTISAQLSLIAIGGTGRVE